MGAIGQPDVTVCIGGDARAGMVITAVADPNDIGPRIGCVVVGPPAYGGHGVEPDDVGAIPEGQHFVRPRVGGRTRGTGGREAE